ncbi:MAG: molybdenum cofactor biosynthesis protein C [Planctomycetes bacterium RBG_16_43_13]|nr:MAG: molybdenum cofactor biosynthesis protein C [Planctomycetes bacterium RBG_16_43_13]
MVDVGGKGITHRVATATATVRMKPATLKLIREKKAKKGDVLEVARVAGISAAKETARLIPMCHSLAITKVEIDYEVKPPNAIVVTATVEAFDRTGVEMEALTAVAICGLTIYDMCKSVDKEIIIDNICLLEKKGGKSGHFRRKI